MLNWTRKFAIRPLVAALAGAALSTGVSGAQIIGTSKMPVGVPPSGSVAFLGKCTEADKVALERLRSNPRQPTLGQLVKVTMTIRNKCSVDVQVAWEILGAAGRVVGSGTEAVGAGLLRDVSATWTATVGEGGFFAWVDPKNLLNESATDRRNNQQSLPLTVAPLSASSQATGGTVAVRLVEQTLDYTKARNAGANFSSTFASGTIGCYDTKVGKSSLAAYSVQFDFVCMNGGEATQEAFGGSFRLAQGWKIKRVEAPYEHIVNNTQFQYIHRPQEETDNPALKIRLTATSPSANARIQLKIIIYGPEGTCPYNAATSGGC